MKRLALTASLLVIVFALPAMASDDSCELCPFDQGAELDAACPNGICNFYIGGNYDMCQAKGNLGQYCYSCGEDVQTRRPSCQRTAKSAACGCSMTQQNNVTTACRDNGTCVFSVN